MVDKYGNHVTSSSLAGDTSRRVESVEALRKEYLDEARKEAHAYAAQVLKESFAIWGDHP